MNKSKIIAISLAILAFSSFSFSAYGSGKGPGERAWDAFMEKGANNPFVPRFHPLLLS